MVHTLVCSDADPTELQLTSLCEEMSAHLRCTSQILSSYLWTADPDSSREAMTFSPRGCSLVYHCFTSHRGGAGADGGVAGRAGAEQLADACSDPRGLKRAQEED